MIDGSWTNDGWMMGDGCMDVWMARWIDGYMDG
jgi:hypothetical protein